jgi:hypothetical protein
MFGFRSNFVQQLFVQCKDIELFYNILHIIGSMTKIDSIDMWKVQIFEFETSHHGNDFSFLWIMHMTNN